MLTFLKSRIRSFIHTNPLRHLSTALDTQGWFGERYVMEDNTQVVLYTDDPVIFPGYMPRRTFEGEAQKEPVKISLVITCRNEQATARQLFAGLGHQTRLPDEIVVVDTGSSDGTLELLHQLTESFARPVRVLHEDGANIARGRNAGIHAASYTIIAVTDFGCSPRRDWLEKLIAPFEIDPQTQVSAGRYEPVDSRGNPAYWPVRVGLEGIDPQKYLPPAVSIAFTRQAWEQVGGFPEWLSLTGEDTYFDLELKRVTGYWAFVPDALVNWEIPTGRDAALEKIHRWSIGNGEVGMNVRSYRRLVAKLGFVYGVPMGALLLFGVALITGATIASLLGFGLLGIWVTLLSIQALKRGGFMHMLFELAANQAQLLGFLAGARNRKVVDQRRLAYLKGCFLMLCGVPIDDSGGGSRGAQIALELIRRQYLVVYLSLFPSYESKNLDLKIRHPNLRAYPLRQFSFDRFYRTWEPVKQDKPMVAILQPPLKDYLPLLDILKSRNLPVIYDLIDDWQTSLGGDWYSHTTEQAIIERADKLVATAPVLKERLERISQREVALLPNAVNLRLFDARRVFKRPKDLQMLEWRIIYIGALWGGWFDWELLAQAARRFSDAAVTVIGDYRGQSPLQEPNIHFLGLKSQCDLPSYLAHSDVAIIPFKVNPVTLATSPLKVFEYLAMRKPVVVTELPLLKNLPFVLCSSNQEDFLRNIEHARGLKPGGEALERFLQENSWQARVDRFVDII